MAVISVLSAKCAPGVTTTVAALATQWPGPVLVIDADPDGGDLLSGWVGPWLVDGHLRTDKSVVSFASSTRHMTAIPAEGLADHVQNLPSCPHVRLLSGVTARAQADAIGTEGWRRVSSAARELSTTAQPDVLVDAGRWGPRTPWPLLSEADLVLIGVRPTLRHTTATLPLVEALREIVPEDRLGAAVSATTSREADNVAQALGIPVGVELPDDPAGARMFSDGATNAVANRRSPLARTARRAACRLNHRVNPHSSTRSKPHSDATQAARRALVATSTGGQ